jgi:hypothetical protein
MPYNEPLYIHRLIPLVLVVVIFYAMQSQLNIVVTKVRLYGAYVFFYELEI